MVLNFSLTRCVQSLLDDNGLADVSSAAEKVKEAVEQQQFLKATELWSVAETVVEQVGATLEPLQPKGLKTFINPETLTSHTLNWKKTLLNTITKHTWFLNCH